MADGNLAKLTDSQLTKLFSTADTLPLSERAKQVLAEMERRGFIYDLRGDDFITCKEWNTRHGHHAPMDCDKQARLRSDNERADGRQQ